MHSSFGPMINSRLLAALEGRASAVERTSEVVGGGEGYPEIIKND